MHGALGTGKKSWREAMTSLPRQEQQGMNPIAAVLCWVATDPGAEARECLSCPEHEAGGDERAACLWVRTRGKANRADVVMGSATDHPARMRRLMKCFIGAWGRPQNHQTLSLWETSTQRYLLEIQPSR